VRGEGRSRKRSSTAFAIIENCLVARYQLEFQILLNLLEAINDLSHNNKCANRDRQIYESQDQELKLEN
jgi:hypothetical protein